MLRYQPADVRTPVEGMSGILSGSVAHEIPRLRSTMEDTMSKPYLVIDLEATCDRRGMPREETEIIEIGAVLCDPVTLEPIDEFQTFIQPVVHTELSAFCTELTSITQADVDGSPFFPEAIAALERWMPGPVLFGSWGAYDRNQFERDRARHKVKLPFGKGHLNLKQAFADRAHSKPVGMAGALRRCRIPLDGTHHRGVDDARNIAKLLPFCLGRIPIP